MKGIARENYGCENVGEKPMVKLEEVVDMDYEYRKAETEKYEAWLGRLGGLTPENIAELGKFFFLTGIKMGGVELEKHKGHKIKVHSFPNRTYELICETEWDELYDVVGGG